MVNYNVTKGKNNRERVLAAIEQCKKEGNISAKRVAQIAGVHECYFSRYPEMRKTLDIAMGIVNRNLKKTKQNDNSKDVLNHALYVELNNLKRENAKLEDYKKYKDMYESKCEEVEELKNSLNKLITIQKCLISNLYGGEYQTPPFCFCRDGIKMYKITTYCRKIKGFYMCNLAIVRDRINTEVIRC